MVDLEGINRNTILYMRILPEFKSYRVDKSMKVCRGFVKLYLFISVLILLVLVALVGGIWLKNNSKNVIDMPRDIKTESSRGRTAEFQKSQLEKNKTYLGYVSLFEISIVDYIIAPNEQGKKYLEDLASEAKKSFPDKFNKADFVIPCVDEKTCISGVEDKEVTLLISVIKDSSVDKYLKETVVKSLVSLGSYEFLPEPKLAGPYNQAFSYAVSVLDMDSSNTKLKEAIVDFEKLIAQKLPTKYQSYKDQNVYKLTNKNEQAQ